jgi:hypothetical protein
MVRAVLVLLILEARDDCRPPQPTYSPDLASADFFFLFLKLKFTLKGRRFQTIEELEENSLRDLRAIPTEFS